MPRQNILIGLHVTVGADAVAATIAAVHETTAQPFDLVLLTDPAPGEAAAVTGALSKLPRLPRRAAAGDGGAAASFNQLIGQPADVYVFMECGVRPARGWLERLLAALAADQAHGIAGPSTNRCWNEQAVAPGCTADPAAVERQSAALLQHYGEAVQPMTRLHNLADFCFAVRGDVVAAIGAADTAYQRGPCWEMDYNVRAARAGFIGVWVQAALVHRGPMPAWRDAEEARMLERSKRLYQDRFCGRRVPPGRNASYHAHCLGEACADFAPAAHTRVHIPLPVPAGETVPLISCIMPTRGRKTFAAQAIAYFRRQDYPNRELVIVYEDDGDLPACIDGPDIRTVRTTQRSIGAKRNEAVRAAHGEIIVHWDDDDWYAEARLSRQALPILQNVADITGLNDILFFDAGTKAFWAVTGALFSRLFVESITGGSLMYRREVWLKAGPYPDISLREDVEFMMQALRKGARLCRLPGRALCIVVRHGQNTWRFGTGQYLQESAWRRVDEPACLGSDRLFYLGLAQTAPVPALAAAPLVSCIMPTANRRRFIAGAITRFLAQDYPAKELIILDDGEDSIADLIPADPAIRYWRTPRHRSLGLKRNAACAAARGEIILHWDDDDWYAPHRIRLQAEAMRTSGADLCGINRVLFVDPRAKAAWEYVYPANGAAWLCGAALGYRRGFWASHPFTDVSIGEDSRFTARAARERMHILPDNRFFVALIHAANTSPKNPNDPRWRPADYAAVARLTGPAWPP